MSRRRRSTAWRSAPGSRWSTSTSSRRAWSSRSERGTGDGARRDVMADRAFVDLHCHTSASFDSLAKPASVVDAAVKRGLTHLAITDHGTIDGALAARAAAPPEITIIVGEEIRTAEGDLIALFLQTAVAQHRPAKETIDEVRAQGGLVGIPHPFDRFRGSLLNDPRLEAMAAQVDWVEAHNARVVGGTGNERAQAFAVEMGLPGIAVSDAHSVV